MMNIYARMSAKSQLATVSDVIDAFGGPKAMCAIFGGVPSRFCNYRTAGKFPDNMHMKIYVAACERNLSIEPSLIGMKSAERQSQLALQAAE
jgi:hypothetical protein